MKLTVNPPAPSPRPDPTYTLELTQDEAEQLRGIMGALAIDRDMDFEAALNHKLFEALYHHTGVIEDEGGFAYRRPLYEIGEHPISGKPCVKKAS